MLTPVIKATKGSQVKEFYNVSDYEKWKKIPDHIPENVVFP
jgi:hypothetical protein